MDEITTDGDKCDYVALNNEGAMGWFGYFISKSKSLKEINFLDCYINNIEDLCRGINNNRSLKNIGFYQDINTLEGNIFGMLDPFFKNNHKLIEVVVQNCELRAEGVRLLSLAIGSCKSLKHFTFANNEIVNGQLADIIMALSVHPQLKKLELLRMNIGRNECTALATLLRNTTKHLQQINLRDNNIGDDRIEALINALGASGGGSELKVLNLGSNPSITTKGWKIVSTLLEIPGSNLVKLDISDNNLGDGGALIFANAVRGKDTLKYLDLSGNEISREGWTSFSKLLCDTSSVNNTYLSNHTLWSLYMSGNVSADVQSYLTLNASSRDKGRIAMTKILQHHSHFDMQPFFEWEFKVLPLIINWLENADACTNEFDEQIKRTKLSCMYDFVREFPMLYIGPVTRKEIEEFSAMEIKMEGDPLQQAELEEVQKCKIRAMRRQF